MWLARMLPLPYTHPPANTHTSPILYIHFKGFKVPLLNVTLTFTPLLHRNLDTYLIETLIFTSSWLLQYYYISTLTIRVLLHFDLDIYIITSLRPWHFTVLHHRLHNNYSFTLSRPWHLHHYFNATLTFYSVTSSPPRDNWKESSPALDLPFILTSVKLSKVIILQGRLRVIILQVKLSLLAGYLLQCCLSIIINQGRLRHIDWLIN